MQRSRDPITLDEAIALEEEVKRLFRSDLPLALERSEAFLNRASLPGAVRARALRARGNTLRVAGRPDESLALLDRALDEFARIGDRSEWASTQTARVAPLCQLGRHADALKAAESGLRILQELGRHDKASRLLANIAGIHYYLGHPAEALAYYDRAGDVARHAPPDPAADARRNLGRAVVLQQLGRYAESLEAARAAGTFFESEGLHLSTAKSLMVQGTALLYLGRYGEGLVTLGRSRALFAERSTPRDVLVCDLFLSACYLELGRLEETAARAGAAARQVSPRQAPFEVACAHTYRGVALGRLGEVEAARTALRTAGRWFAAHGYTGWAAYTAMEGADLALRAGDWAEAEAAALKAGQAFARAQMAAFAARAHLIRAEALLEGFEKQAVEGPLPEQVEPFLSRAARIARREGLPGLTFRVAHLRGRLSLQQADPRAAIRHLKRAIGLAERLRVTLQPPFRTTFLDDRASAYRDLVHALWAAGRAREAHRLVDRIKARTLVDRLAVDGTEPAPRSPREARVMAELAEARRRYRSLGSLTLPLPDAETKEMGLRGGLPSAGTVHERRELEARIVALSDELELLRAGQRPGSGAPRPRRIRLAQEEGLLEYFVTRDRILGFLTDRRGLRRAVELGRPEAVHQALALFYLNVEATAQEVQRLGSRRLQVAGESRAAFGPPLPSSGPPAPGALEPLAANARALLRRLHRHLFEPFGESLATLRRLVVVPHGFLHALPFAALFDGTSHAVEERELVVAPSVALWQRASELEASREGTGPLPNAVVVAHSLGGLLPGTEAEAREVASMLGTQALTGAQATSAALSARPARLIHVAAHGEFRHESPRFSALYLADGPFTAQDASQLRLDASLAVLSSCRSGVGRVSQADELAGLAAGFVMGGCRSVVASRWRISDAATVTFMRSFYRHLLRGETKAGALRSAQREMMHAGWNHPFFWAAFGLIGASGPL